MQIETDCKIPSLINSAVQKIIKFFIVLLRRQLITNVAQVVRDKKEDQDKNKHKSKGEGKEKNKKHENSIKSTV